MIFFNKKISECITLIEAITYECTINAVTRLEDLYNAYLTLETNTKIVKYLNNFKDKDFKSLSRENQNVILKYLTEEFVIYGWMNNRSHLQSKYNLFSEHISEEIRNSMREIVNLRLQVETSRILLVTAVPKEFRALYKKLNIIRSCKNLKNNYNSDSNTSEWSSFVKILDEKNDGEKRTGHITVDAAISRDDIDVPVRILLLQEYGNDASKKGTALSLDNSYIEEVILVGVAGHMSNYDNVKIGDLVLADGFYSSTLRKEEKNIDFLKKNICEIGFDYGSIDYKEWIPSDLSEKVPSSSDNRTKYRYGKAEVHKGSFISGNSVVKYNSYKTEYLNSYPDSYAIEMEAEGCYNAIKEHHSDIPFKIIKSICDWSDEEKNKEWQPYCAELAVEFSIDYLIQKFRQLKTKKV